MSSALGTIFASGEIFPVVFVELHFASGPEYLWSGLGSIVWNSHTWSGLGSLAGISTIEESVATEAKGVVLTCSGLDPTLLTDLLSQVQVGLPALIFLGSFTTSARTTLVADPLTAWSGRIDQSDVSIGAETATISINCEDRLVEMNVAVDRRWTNDDQVLDHPGDQAFSFVQGQLETFIFWGVTPFQQFSK